ncbi:protein FAM200C-like [Lycorma delicatula]|uniref:protein FAM200C-like n=1 Tax=Lycorma delicatula TaxID=130591 RepID=UPI003F50E598
MKGISGHLVSLKNEIGYHFPDVSSENWELKLTKDPFKIDVDILPNHIQKPAIDLKCDSQANAEFRKMNVEDFWLNYFPVYRKLALEAAKWLVQFSSTYICESGFLH